MTATPPGEYRWRVELELPQQFEPEQVHIDSEGVLLEAYPANNAWNMLLEACVTPLYTMLIETGLTANMSSGTSLRGRGGDTR